MATTNNELSIMSFNMHGFMQGCPVLDDMIVKYDPDVLLLQEHWLTPANLSKFDDHFVEYFSVGCSAMSSRVECGMLLGRPFGCVMTSIKKSLRKNTETVYCSDRYVIVRIADCLFVNVYLPCVGTNDHTQICEDIFFRY